MPLVEQPIFDTSVIDQREMQPQQRIIHQQHMPQPPAIATTQSSDCEVEYEALPENSSLTANLIAGAFAGIMEHAVMYPVDAVKTRMQVAHSTGVYRGVLSSISRISATEGSASLWRGISSVFIGAGPAHAVYFAVYEAVKSAYTTHSGTGPPAYSSPLVTSIAGAAATTASDGLMNPFDVVKQRMQLFGSKYSSFGACVMDIWRREGFRAFYVSYPTTLIMNVPFTATNFTVYESMSQALNPTKKHDPLTHVIAGGVAGGMAAALTTPLDVIKTLLQTRGANLGEAGAPISNMKVLKGGPPLNSVEHINSFAKAAAYIYRTAGPSGFLRGLRPRIVANMPSTAICWTSYEMAKFYINRAS